MARILSTPADLDPSDADAALSGAGVQVLQALDAEGTVEVDVLELLLPPQARHVREVLTLEPAGPIDQDSGMGAWHVNSVDEVHSVLDGQGVMEFVTGAGIISVLVEAGDVVVIQQAEHRYLPLTHQRWAVRWSGTPDTGLQATETGRPAQPWPRI